MVSKIMFTQAIVRRPCPAIVNGLTTSTQGKPDYQQAMKQHLQYLKALMACGLKIHLLEADNRYPDSTFVEDTALITPEFAIITNPGAPSRKGEINDIVILIRDFFHDVQMIDSPGAIDGGDIMRIGSHYYIGLSKRTNEEGAKQMIDILGKYDLSGSMITLENVLHLKTGVSYLENNNLLAIGEFIEKNEFEALNIIPVDEDESYAANSIWVNGYVIMPSGYPKTQHVLEEIGYKILAVNTSEFRKIDGGVSCLSLRF